MELCSVVLVSDVGSFLVIGLESEVSSSGGESKIPRSGGFFALFNFLDVDQSIVMSNVVSRVVNGLE